MEPPKLVLTNVDFKYFIKDYEALIYVENNNFHKGASTPADDILISLLGEDRGADITMTNTNVLLSRFCKGMLVYYSRKSQYSYQPFQIANQVYYDASAQGP